jgi:uncharacterized membrane protein YdjX (TVP38/TMEM64 family)
LCKDRPLTLTEWVKGLRGGRLRTAVLSVTAGAVDAIGFLALGGIGMLPGTVVYVYLGSTVKELADLAAGKFEGGTARLVLFFVGLAATVVVTIYVTRLARRALRQAVPEPETEGTPHA